MPVFRDTEATPALNRWAAQVNSQLQELATKPNPKTDLSNIEAQITNVQDVITPVTTPPDPATGISVSENGLMIDGNLYSEVSITYTAPADIAYFAGIYLVVANYLGSSELVKVSEHNYIGVGGGTASFKVILNRTNETVTFFAVAKNISGLSASWGSAPSAVAVLDGNASAPNPPTGLAAGAFSLGVNLTWNENVETNVKAYNVWRNLVNNFTGATQIGQAPASGGIGSLVNFLDRTGVIGTTYYYWITAVNSSGMESSASASANTASTKLNLDDATDGTTNVNFLAVQRTKGIDIDGNLLLKNVNNYGGVTSGPATNSTTFSTIPEMVSTITTYGNKVLMIFSGTFLTSSNNTSAHFAVFRDGVQVSPDFQVVSNNFGQAAFSFAYIDAGASAASHTYEIKYRSQSGTVTVTMNDTQRLLQVVELG